MTKLVLVNLWRRSPYPFLGFGYIASYMEKYGGYDDIEVIESESRDAVEKIKKARPDIVGFTAVTPNYYLVEDVAKTIKEELGVTSLIGGSHITPLPGQLSKAFDIGVIGEGEKTFLELMELFESGRGLGKRSLNKVEGIVFHDGKKKRITSPRRFINPLDDIPFPKRDIFDMEGYLKPKDILCNQEILRGTSLLTSRGCPYRCVYCQASSHWGNIRLNSSKYVSEEIKLLHDKYKIEGICIIDDLFTVDHKRVQEIVSHLKEYGILGEIKFLVDGRANMINNDILALLKKMNVVQISIGFESGSDRMLKYLKKNTVALKQNLDAIKKISRFGFGIYGQFMIGSPAETKKDMYDTLKLIKNDNITAAHISITTPLPGTELWGYCVQKGIIDPNKVDWERFDLEPTRNGIKENIYINDAVPFKEFESIYAEFREASLMKEMSNLNKVISFDMLKKAIRKPKKALKILPKFIKKQMFHKN